MEEIKTKKCSKCGEEKPATLEYFVTEKRNKSGIGARCRPCQYRTNELYHQKNPDIIKKHQRAWYDRNKDNERYYPKKDYSSEKWRTYYRERSRKLREDDFFRFKDNVI